MLITKQSISIYLLLQYEYHNLDGRFYEYLVLLISLHFFYEYLIEIYRNVNLIFLYI